MSSSVVTAASRESRGNRSTTSLMTLNTSVISGGNLESISLTPHNKNKLSDERSERVFSPAGGLEESFFDFNLSQEEFDELLGSTHSFVSNDTSIHRLPPLKKDHSRIEDVLFGQHIFVEHKKPATKIESYKPIPARLVDPLTGVTQREPRFKYLSRSLGASKSAPELEDFSAAVPPTLSHSMSKVSILLSDTSVDDIPSTTNADLQRRIPPPKFTGKFFSKTSGVLTAHERRPHPHNLPLHGPSALQAQSSIEYSASMASSLEAMGPGPGPGPELHPQPAAHIERATTPLAMPGSKPGSRGAKGDEMIAIPTARARTPTAPNLSMFSMDTDQEVEPSPSRALEQLSLRASASDFMTDSFSRQVSRSARRSNPSSRPTSGTIARSSSRSPDSDGVISRPTSGKPLSARARTPRTASKPGSRKGTTPKHARGRSPSASLSPSPERKSRQAYVLSTEERAIAQDQRRREKLQPILSAASAQAPQSVEADVMEHTSQFGPFIPHRKILGWKLTSVKKRQELVELLDLLSHTQSAATVDHLQQRLEKVQPPVGRRKQLLLSQLEAAMRRELEATRGAFQPQPSVSPSSLDEEWDPQMVAADKAQFERVYFRQSVAYENYLERSLEARLSYGGKVGIHHRMDENRALKKLVKTSVLHETTARRTRGLGGLMAATTSRSRVGGTKAATESFRDGTTSDSLRVLQATAQSFEETVPRLDRPMSRLLNARSALHSQGKLRETGGGRSATASQVLYDFPYNIHRPLDRMDIIKSVQTRALLAPSMAPTEMTEGGAGAECAERTEGGGIETRNLFSREAAQLIATTSGQHAQATVVDTDSDALLQDFANSDNELLRMLSQDQPDALETSDLAQMLDASMVSGASSVREDDDLVDAFIESRYKAARLKKRGLSRPGGPMALDGDDTPTLSARGEDEDDKSLGNMSMSSLGDQSAALYDMILPTAAPPPLRSRANSMTDSTTFGPLGIASLQSLRADSPTTATLPSADESRQEFGLGLGLGLGLETEPGETSSIPITPW